MLQSHTASLLVILATSSVLFYKSSFLKNRRFLKLNLHQILYLFVLPSISSVLILSYALDITKFPKSGWGILPDTMLLNVIFLSMLFVFAGKAVHTVTKALHDAGLRDDKTQAGHLNHFLHTTFSHNFILGGLILLGTSLVLLEINHITDPAYKGSLMPIARGLLMGLAMVGSMVVYVRPEQKGEVGLGKWSDLKTVFAISWVAFIILVSLTGLVDIPLRQYQFLLPTISGLAVINGLNILLSLRNKIKKNRLQS